MLAGRGLGKAVSVPRAAVGTYRPWLYPPRAVAPRGFRSRQQPQRWEPGSAAEGDATGWISRLLKEKGEFPLFSGHGVQP